MNDSNQDHVHPDHYKHTTKEVWQMMVNIWGVGAFITYCEINAFKYRMRAGRKAGNSVEQDIEKARWYEDKANELNRF